MALGGSAARRYAEALLDIATSDGAVAPYRASLERLAQAIGPEAIRALRDPRSPLARRRAALGAATNAEPKAVRAVLALLLDRDRIALLPAIARAYGELVDRREGIAKAKIVTTVELSEREQRELVAGLERASGTRIRATFAVDPALIGGATIQLGDHLVDASIRAQLASLARTLAGS
jgi:F-type H+-transporting ATPase subunit delta